MELRQLRYFCTSCATGSFSAAAKELFVSEQAICSGVNKLEKELECVLLTRGKQGVRPTAAGETLFARGSALLREADDIIAAIRPKATPSSIRFAYVTDSIMTGDVALSFDAVEDFGTKHPETTIHAFECSTASCIRNILEGAADIALVAGEVDATLFDAQLVMRGRQVVAFPADSPLAGKDALDFTDLKDLGILMPPETDYTLPVILRLCHERGFDPHIVPTPRREYFDAAANGRGAAFVPMGHPSLKRADLTARSLAASDDFTVPLYLIRKKGVANASIVAEFESYLLESWKQ